MKRNEKGKFIQESQRRKVIVEQVMIPSFASILRIQNESN